MSKENKMNQCTKTHEAIKALQSYKEIYPNAVPNRPIAKVHYFKPNGTFAAVRNATKFVKDKGYSIGSMQRNYPIAIVMGDAYISKWFNLKEDKEKIDGVIIPATEFREGGAVVIIFAE